MSFSSSYCCLKWLENCIRHGPVAKEIHLSSMRCRMSIRIHQCKMSSVVEGAESGTVFSMAPKTMLENWATRSPTSPVALRKQLTKLESSFTDQLQNTIGSALINWSFLSSFSCHVTHFNSYTSISKQHFLHTCKTIERFAGYRTSPSGG